MSTDSDQLRPGDVFGPYRIEGPLGEGGMGLVYRATDARGDLVALKMIRAKLASDERFRKRVQREAVAAGFSDGLVVLADIATGRILPIAGPGRGPVSALAWSMDGSQLALGTETGFAALVDFAKR